MSGLATAPSFAGVLIIVTLMAGLLAAGAWAIYQFHWIGLIGFAIIGPMVSRVLVDLSQAPWVIALIAVIWWWAG